jgi:hypothetical protein
MRRGLWLRSVSSRYSALPATHGLTIFSLSSMDCSTLDVGFEKVRDLLDAPIDNHGLITGYTAKCVRQS